MAAFDYAKLRKTADGILAKYGQAGTLVVLTSTGEAWNPTQTEEEHAVTLVIGEYSWRERTSELIQATDKRAYVSAEGIGVAPEPGHKLIVGGVRYSILSVNTVSPAGTDVLYDCQIRR